MSAAAGRAAFGPFDRLPVVRFSDAHKPEEIGTATTEFLVNGASLGEIRLALAGEDGRKVFAP